MSLEKWCKKLVSVLPISTLVTRTKEEVIETAETAEAVEATGASKNSKKIEGGEHLGNFAWVSYIWYPIIFRKKTILILMFFDSGIEVNTIHPTFAQELGLIIRPTDVRV